jgi:surfactin synthase thioesterase subunit
MTIPRARNPWIAAGAAPEGGEIRLLCFAHAGGGSSLFSAWRAAIGPRVRVLPVLLPGREARLREEPFRRMEDLIDPLVSGLWELTEEPVAIFGHSLGSIVGYEVGRVLTARGRPPRALLVSGRRAPHLPARLPDAHGLDEPGFLDALRGLGGTPEELLGDRSLLASFLPTLRADFELNETYLPLPGPPLPCDIVGFGGTDDPQMTPSELAAWGEVTTGDFRYHLFDGNHFYLQPPRRRLLDLIEAALLS